MIYFQQLILTFLCLLGPAARADVAETQQGVLPTGLVQLTRGTAGTEQLDNLSAGTFYYCRVAAESEEGIGSPKLCSPESETPRTTPGVATSVALVSLSTTSIKLTWSFPSDGSSSGGAAITKFLVEWDTTASFDNIENSGYQYEVTNLNSPLFNDGAGKNHLK